MAQEAYVLIMDADDLFWVPKTYVMEGNIQVHTQQEERQWMLIRQFTETLESISIIWKITNYSQE